MSHGVPPTYRARDRWYALFLVSYVFVIVFFDCLSLYPPQMVPERLLSLQSWYKDYYNDQLVIRQPPWFRFFSIVEALYQLPISVWSIWALTNKSAKAPTHLLVWAVICCGTTLTCLFEFYHNELMSNQEKGALIAMYGSYAVIFSLIGVDMFTRIQRTLVDIATARQPQKSE